MLADDELKKLIKDVMPLLEISLDPICIVNHLNEIVYMDLPMKSLLGLKGRELRKRNVFCDVLKLSACQTHCQIQHVLDTGHPFRLDELPASRGPKKLRVAFKAIPLFRTRGEDKGKPVGAIITVRETTGEVLLQAKYHKLMEMLKERDDKISTLEERLNALQTSIRRHRQSAAS
jgi:hypothetical protein